MNDGDRVYSDEFGYGNLLRLERYPGTGDKKWATVIWDWAMSARRVEPATLTVVP